MSRVAVVTGGASGIGLGVARQLVADGHRVAVLDRDRAGAEGAAAELEAEGGKAVAVEVDVAAACSFLCSDGGSYITGQLIGVNGGMYI